VVPLAALVFLGAFVPVVGAVLSGSVAVLIALVAQGPVTAAITLGVVIAVMQVEGHVLQPLLLGRAVRLHPLAVVLSVAGGVVVGGIAGALLAVPLVAVLTTGFRALAEPAEPSIPGVGDTGEPSIPDVGDTGEPSIPDVGDTGEPSIPDVGDTGEPRAG
jgi:predicted PurR-regulated permease PerM